MSNAAEEAAATLFDEDLVGVVARTGGQAFLGRNGSVFFTKTPLGPLVDVVRAPFATVAAAMSDEAIVAVTERHDLMRSTDFGHTWTPVTFSAGAVLDLVLTRSGRGLALLMPEGVAITVDHGATFTRVATRLDCSYVTILDNGAPFVGARGVGARLEAGLLRPTRDETEDAASRPTVTVAVAGSTAVRLREKGTGHEVAIGPLREPPVYRAVPDFSDCTTVVASAFGKVISLGCVRPSGYAHQIDERLSLDGGTTFVRQPLRPFDREAALHVVGPDGFLLTRLAEGLTGLRPRSGADIIPVSARLGSARLNPAGTAFVALRMVEDSAELIVSPVSVYQPRVKGVVPGYQPRAELSLRDDGAIFGVVQDTKSSTSIEVSAKQDPLELRPTALPRARWSLAGERGLAWKDDHLYETWDGGAHVFAVGSVPATGLSCSGEGCLVGEDARLGWDHPEMAKHHPAAPIVTPEPSAVASPERITCKLGKKQAEWMPPLDLRRDYPEGRLRALSNEVAVVRPNAQGKLEKVALLPWTELKEETVLHARREGVIAVRYTIAAKKKGDVGLRPVSVKVAWLRNGEKAPHVEGLGELGTFRILASDVAVAGPFGHSLVGFLDGAIAVQPTYAQTLGYSGEASRHVLADSHVFLLKDSGAPRERLEAPDLDSLPHTLVKTKAGYLVAPDVPLDGLVTLHTSPDGFGWKKRLLQLWFKKKAVDPFAPPKPPAWWVSFLSGPAPTYGIVDTALSRAILARLEEDVVVSAPTFDLTGPVPLGCKGGVGAQLVLEQRTRFVMREGTSDKALDLEAWVTDGKDRCIRAVGGVEAGVIIPLDDPQHAFAVRAGALHELACSLP